MTTEVFNDNELSNSRDDITIPMNRELCAGMKKPRHARLWCGQLHKKSYGTRYLPPSRLATQCHHRAGGIASSDLPTTITPWSVNCRVANPMGSELRHRRNVLVLSMTSI